ncbi:MAG TPA: hypothetical protein DCQ64_12990 [Candidatus Rokubacteria bacterium]|nr:hypothetical protein [Candidatus Rokubacteria bacterium]
MAAISGPRIPQARPCSTANPRTIQKAVAEASRSSAAAWPAMHATMMARLLKRSPAQPPPS